MMLRWSNRRGNRRGKMLLYFAYLVGVGQPERGAIIEFNQHLRYAEVFLRLSI